MKSLTDRLHCRGGRVSLVILAINVQIFQLHTVESNQILKYFTSAQAKSINRLLFPIVISKVIFFIVVLY